MSKEDQLITVPLVYDLIFDQFPEFANLKIEPVKVQGHDNRSFRLGKEMLIRMPIADSDALKVPKEQEFLPFFQRFLTTRIPMPLKMGKPSIRYPFHFSIYQWLDGESANSVTIDDDHLKDIAQDLAKFLRELQIINTSSGLKPGLHNWYRGDHINIYSEQARDQIIDLQDVIDSEQALKILREAVATRWEKPPVWIHGDFASGNILIKDNKLAAVIDFGGTAIGDPACDLVIAWTFLKGESREIFRKEVNLDYETWLRAKAWALWKATYELCKLKEKNGRNALKHTKIIKEILSE